MKYFHNYFTSLIILYKRRKLNKTINNKMDNEQKFFTKQKQENASKKRKKLKNVVGYTQQEKHIISKLNDNSDNKIYNETEIQTKINTQKTPKLKKLKKRCNSRSVTKSSNVNKIINKPQSLNKIYKKETDSKIEKENQGYNSDINMKKIPNNHHKKKIIEFRKKMRNILYTMRYKILLKKYFYHWKNITNKEKRKSKQIKQTYRNPIIYGPIEHNNDDDFDDSEETQNNNKFLMDGQLEEIEERAADEEESVATSVHSKVKYNNNNRNTNILILRKIIKYKNILHRYFRQWYGMVGVGISLQEYKKLRKSTKLNGSATNIKRNSPKNSTSNTNIHQTILELEVENYTPEKIEEIKKNIITFFELGGFKERIEKKYYNIWKKKTIKNNLYKSNKIKKSKNVIDNSGNNNIVFKRKINIIDPCKVLKKLFIKINNKKLLYHFLKKWNFIIKNTFEDSKRSIKIKPHIKILKKDINKDKNTNNDKTDKKIKTKKIYDNSVNDNNNENNSGEGNKSLTDSHVFYNSDAFHNKIEPNEIDEKKTLHLNKSRDDYIKRNIKKFKNNKQNKENSIKLKNDHEERLKYKINPFKTTENENEIKHKEIFEKIKFTKFRHKKNKNQRFLIYQNYFMKNKSKKEKDINNFNYNYDNYTEYLLKKLNILIIKKWIRNDKKAKYFDKWFDSTFNNPKYLPFIHENYYSTENLSNKFYFTNESKRYEKRSSLNNNYINRGKDLILKEYDDVIDKTPKKKSIRKKKKENDNNIKNNFNDNCINYSKEIEINPDIEDIEIMQNDEPEIQIQKLNYINNNKYARQLLKILFKNYQQRLKINQANLLKKYLHKWKTISFLRHIQQKYNYKIFAKKIKKFSLVFKKIIFQRVRILLSLRTTRSNTMANIKNKKLKKPSIDWHELSKDDLRSDSNMKTTNSNEDEDNFGQSSSMNSFIQKIENLMKSKDSSRNIDKKLKSKKVYKKNKLLSEIIKKLIIKENNLKKKFYFNYWIKYIKKTKQKKINIIPKSNKLIKKTYHNKKIKQDINLLETNDNNDIIKKSFSSSESIDNNNSYNNNNNKIHPSKESLEYQDKQESLVLPSIKYKSLQNLIKENKLSYDAVINNLLKNKESFTSITSSSNTGNEESKNDVARKRNNLARRSLQRSNICKSLTSNGEEKKLENGKSSTTKNINISKYIIEKNKYISDFNKLKCDNIKIMNKNYEMLSKNSKKYEKFKVPGYLEILKKQNKINSAYQIFCIYAFFKDNNKKYILKKSAFNKWKNFCIFKNVTNKYHIQYKCGHCIKCKCNKNKFDCLNYTNCDKCNCKKINKSLKKLIINFKFLKYMNPKKYYFYFWLNNK